MSARPTPSTLRGSAGVRGTLIYISSGPGVRACVCAGACEKLGYCPHVGGEPRNNPRIIAGVQAKDPTLWREPGSPQEAARLAKAEAAKLARWRSDSRV